MSNIVLITGATGSGKSTISHRVAESFPKSIHIQVDNLRDMMVTGMVPPKSEWSEEEKQQVLQQFQWARSTAIHMAKLYASQGVDVVIDDVITPNFVEQYAALFEIPGVHRVLLYPKASAVIERVKQRGGPWDHVLIDFVSPTYNLLEPMPKDAFCLLISLDGEHIAYALSNNRPGLPSQAFYLDSMGIRPKYRGKGFGAALFRTLTDLSAWGAYTRAIFFCPKQSQNGVDLVNFYSKLGAKEVGVDENNLIMMAIPLEAGNTF